jgi:glycosyltransferase involved in cell wall biosynthesis
MWNGKKVSIVLSTYNEKDSIRKCIDMFFATGYVDEVIVVDNNAIEGTSEEVLKTKATLICETKQGYGHGYQLGLSIASGDLLVMSEPDGTFCPSDLTKFLAYAENNNIDARKPIHFVLGSRTNATMILEGANMGMFLKYGNYFVAKMIELLFIKTAPHLSDCGCTYRLITREAYELMNPHFKEGGSAFGLEMTLLALRLGLPICEIPVNYLERVGNSSVTGSFLNAFILGIKMIILSWRHFIKEQIKPIYLGKNKW